MCEIREKANRYRKRRRRDENRAAGQLLNDKAFALTLVLTQQIYLIDF